MRKTLLAALVAVLAVLPFLSAPSEAAYVGQFKLATLSNSTQGVQCSNRYVSPSNSPVQAWVCFGSGTNRFHIKDADPDGRAPGVQWKFDGKTGICQHRKGADAGWWSCDYFRYMPFDGRRFQARIGDCHHVQKDCTNDSNWVWTDWYTWVS